MLCSDNGDSKGPVNQYKQLPLTYSVSQSSLLHDDFSHSLYSLMATPARLMSPDKIQKAQLGQ
jgi:hypothetical protein